MPQLTLADTEQKEFWACLALRHTQGIGPRTWKRLIEGFGSAYQAVMQYKEWGARKLAREGLAETLATDAWRERARQEWDAVRESHCRLLLHTSPYYPRRLWEIPDPPLYLFAQGDASLLGAPSVGVVGTRQSTVYGRDTTCELCTGLSKAGLTIVSGLAYGIDRQAHISALEGPGSSIAVLGAGLDVNYPAGNADVRTRLGQKGLVLTEYAPGVTPEPRNFPVRNRIISGLSLGVIVVEASEKSGSMITARQALDQGREVFAVPGPRGSKNHKGCFWLINQGAKLICSAEEVLQELAPLLKEWRLNAPAAAVERRDRFEEQEEAVSPPELFPVHTAPSAQSQKKDVPQDLDPEQRDLLHVLQETGELHIDMLAEKLAWDAPRVSRTLLLLEMRGLVRQQPGMIYSIV